MCRNGAAAATALTPAASARSNGSAKPRSTAAPSQSVRRRSSETCAGANRSRVLVALCTLRQLRLRNPPAVNLTDRTHRQVHGRDRAVGEMLGVEDHEIRAPALGIARRDTHQITPAFGRVRALRREAALGE